VPPTASKTTTVALPCAFTKKMAGLNIARASTEIKSERASSLLLCLGLNKYSFSPRNIKQLLACCPFSSIELYKICHFEIYGVKNCLVVPRVSRGVQSRPCWATFFSFCG